MAAHRGRHNIKLLYEAASREGARSLKSYQAIFQINSILNVNTSVIIILAEISEIKAKTEM